MKKIYLLDGMSLVFRAYHALGQANLVSPDGMPTSAIFGFTNIITSLIEKEKPEYLSIVFDRSEPTFRHDLYPEYKANRDAFPEDLSLQMPYIKELIDLLSIPRYEIAGYEADDIIGSIAKQYSSKEFITYCITSDKDYYQLVDENIKILKPGSRGEDFIFVDYNQVYEKFGVTPDKVIDVMALIGDSVDNIPGVKGIGEKTAIPLIQKFSTLGNLYKNLANIDKKSVLAKLENDKDMAYLSKTLVTIKTDINLELSVDKLKVGKPNYEKLDLFFQKVGFNTIRLRWKEKSAKETITNPDQFSETINISAPIENTIDSTINTLSNSDKDYQFINSFEKLENLIEKINSSKLISFDLETDSLNRNLCEIVGIAITDKENCGYYIPTEIVGEFGNINSYDLFSKASNEAKWKDSLDTIQVLKLLKPILENENIGKCGQNAKFDMYILKRFGIDVSPLVFDSMIASYLINPDDKHNLDALSRKYLNYSPIPITNLIGEKKSEQISMRDVDPQKISTYAAEDADLALKLKNTLQQKLIEEDLNILANDIEFPLVKVLTQMEFDGVSIDRQALSTISQKVDIELVKLTKDIFYESGVEFNIDSPKQLGEVLFEKMNIPPQKKNKTGYSTDLQVLTELAYSYPFVNKILEYRHLGKLKSTYIDALPKLINPTTNRIHTTYNQTVASTGRLSSTDPNLQNIPIRTALGKEIRKAFIPVNDEFLIMSADYSQIELRVMAYICQDKQMIEGFKEGLDVHSATASVLNGVPVSEVNADMRRIAKTVNFGIMYGLGSFGLSQRLGLSRKESKEIIENYFEKYPGIKKYMELTINETGQKGYAETLCKRRRYFTDINSKNHNLRTSAERGAINMPIQGTSSDMLKIAMNKIFYELKQGNFKSKLIMQVHDELVLEVHNSEKEEIRNIVITNMTNALPLGEVPVLVEAGFGKNWYEAH